MKIMTVLGTRPEIIRLSRVIEKLDRLGEHGAAENVLAAQRALLGQSPLLQRRLPVHAHAGLRERRDPPAEQLRLPPRRAFGDYAIREAER